MKNGPCLEKGCSWCCNPVKIIKFTLKNIPKNKKGENIRKLLNEQRIPEKHPDSVKLELYECLLLDKDTGLCKDYQNRPKICKNSSCINPKSKKNYRRSIFRYNKYKIL